MSGMNQVGGGNADENVGLVYRQPASRRHGSEGSAHVRLAGMQFRGKLAVGVGLVPHHAFFADNHHDHVLHLICEGHILNVKACALQGQRVVEKSCMAAFETHEDRQAFERR